MIIIRIYAHLNLFFLRHFLIPIRFQELTLFFIAGSAPHCIRMRVNFRRPIAAAMWRGVSWFCVICEVNPAG